MLGRLPLIIASTNDYSYLYSILFAQHPSSNFPWTCWILWQKIVFTWWIIIIIKLLYQSISSSVLFDIHSRKSLWVWGWYKPTEDMNVCIQTNWPFKNILSKYILAKLLDKILISGVFNFLNLFFFVLNIFAFYRKE